MTMRSPRPAPDSTWTRLAHGVLVALLVLLAACSKQHELWSDRTPADQIPRFEQVSPPDLNAVAAGADGVLVAVGDRGTILRSSDKGMSWATVARRVTESTLRDVTAAPGGALVAVGDKGCILRSQDGAAWEVAPHTGTGKSLRRVLALSKDVLLAVGDEGTIVRSVNGGRSWSPVSGGDGPTLWDVTAGDGQLLAVGDAGYIYRSEDGGRSWSLAKRDAGTLRRVLVTRGGARVAVGEYVSRAASGRAEWAGIRVPSISPGGIDNMPFTQLVEAAGGVLAALGPGRQPQYSRDGGASWAMAATGGALPGFDVLLATLDGALAALGHAQAMRSTDGGANWTPASAPKAGSALTSAVALPGGALVAVGLGATILRSGDGGVTWVAVGAAGRKERLHAVAAGVDNVLVAVGDFGAIMRSPDNGQTWAEVADTGTDDTLRQVLSQVTGPWVAVGQLGRIVVSANGGENWEPARAPPSTNELRDLLAVGPPGVLVAVGDGGTILRSENGGWDWELVPRVSDKGLYRVVLHRGVLVTVGEEGTILRSTDGGKNWRAAANSGTDRLLLSIASSGDALVACGSGQNVVRAVDLGNNFVPIETPGASLESIVAGRNQTLIALGNRPGVNAGVTMVRSVDGGRNWAPITQGLTGYWLTKVVVQSGGVMLGLGGRMLRSIDDGATWSEVPGSRETAGLNDGLTAQDGRFVAIGEQGMIVREAGRQSAPAIRRLVHQYDMEGNPVVSISLADPDKLCPRGACLAAWARSEHDNARNKAGERQEQLALLDSAGGMDEYELKIDPALAADSRPTALYLSLVVDVPGHHRVYQPKPGADFVVPNDPEPIWKNPWFLAVTLPLAALVLLLLVAAIKPLWLLPLMTVQKDLTEHGVSGWPGRALTLLVRIVLPMLSVQPRVLNAWVELHAPQLASAFAEAAKNVSDLAPYVALPVMGPDGAHMVPTPENLVAFFKPKRVFLEIVGQGGAGKTRLALQICSWLERSALVSHPAAAILVDEEFDDVLAVIAGKLKAALGEQAPTSQFLGALLAHGRLWIVIDRVSERQQSTRRAVARVYQSAAPKVVICTSRMPVALDGQPKISLAPEPLDQDTLEYFILVQLRTADAQRLFADRGQLVSFIEDMAPHAAGQAAARRVTPLLVTIVVTQAIESARAHGTAALANLPRNVPEIYFSYVQRLDETRQDPPRVAGISPGALVRQAASIIACIELGDDFRPKRVDDVKVNQALMADERIKASQIDFIDRFDQNGLLSRRTIGAESTVEYLLDPLAECLAAYVHARACGSSQEKWDALLGRVAGLGEGVQGFAAALRMNHEAYAREFGFPSVVFPAAP